MSMLGGLVLCAAFVRPPTLAFRDSCQVLPGLVLPTIGQIKQASLTFRPVH